jgi:hypothetical protein
MTQQVKTSMRQSINLLEPELDEESAIFAQVTAFLLKYHQTHVSAVHAEPNRTILGPYAEGESEDGCSLSRK